MSTTQNVEPSKVLDGAPCDIQPPREWVIQFLSAKQSIDVVLMWIYSLQVRLIPMFELTA